MIPVKCQGPCGLTLSMFDVHHKTVGDNLQYWCDECDPVVVTVEPGQNYQTGRTFQDFATKHPFSTNVVATSEPFSEPEPGSQERYIRRKTKRPWTAHTFWWIVHNCVSHPMIGFVPLKPFFSFHDWTSRKMHGE